MSIQEKEVYPRLAYDSEGTDGIDTDWLSSLPVGTRVLSLDKRLGIIREIEILSRSTSGITKLVDLLGKEEITWVIPEVFCSKNKKLDILE